MGIIIIIISLAWRCCEGVILRYSLSRDGVEIFRHPNALSYHDSNAVVPYHTYRYQLEACNSADCVTSSKVTTNWRH